MKRMFGYLMLVLMSSTLLAQTTWERYGNSPVLELGPAGSWDDYAIGGPEVLEVDDTLRMWYAGVEDGNSHYAIGYAWSLDGITWTKWEHNPVLEVGIDGSWDANRVNFPEVTYQDGNYIMWYAGKGNAYPYDRMKVGIARASDPVHWVKDTLNNPVLEGSADGSWDDKNVAPMAVQYDGSEYTMWYNGRQSGGHYQMGRAFSTDGVTDWVRDILNPIIPNGAVGEWDYQEAYGNSICHVGELVEIYYTGINSGIAVGLATSSGGDEFTKHPGNPIFESASSGAWDDDGVSDPFVIYDATSENFRMWYTGWNGNQGQIGYATAPLDPTVSIEDKGEFLPESIILNQNYPNPFNPQTQIRYLLSESMDIKLVVHDVMGREVTELVNNYQEIGNYKISWNGTDGLGKQVATGIYFARLTSGKHSDVIKMIYLR